MKKLLAVTLAIVMVFSLSTLVSAAVSPTATTGAEEPKITINYTDVASITKEINYEDKTIKFTVEPEDGFTFDRWEVENGDIIDGDENSETITVSFDDDPDSVVALAYFIEDATGFEWIASSEENTPARRVDDEEPTTDEPDETKRTGRQMGDTTTTNIYVTFILLAAVLAFGAVAFSRKKLAK